MALHGNISRNNAFRGFGLGIWPALTSGNIYRGGERFNWMRQMNATTIVDKAARPEGYYAPAVYYMAMTAGAMVSRLVSGSGDLVAAITEGRNITADLVGSGDITNALAGLIISMTADLVGSGDITDAQANAIAVCVADLTGSGDITAATLAALGNLVADLTGTGDVTDAILTAIGSMSADINVTGDLLTTGNVATAIWGAFSASYNEDDTFGNLLNNVGAGANPWTAIIEAGYTAEEILRLMAAVLLGDSSGFDTAPVFKGLDGTTDRVSSDLDADGNRSNTVLDPN